MRYLVFGVALASDVRSCPADTIGCVGVHGVARAAPQSSSRTPFRARRGDSFLGVEGSRRLPAGSSRDTAGTVTRTRSGFSKCGFPPTRHSRSRSSSTRTFIQPGTPACDAPFSSFRRAERSRRRRAGSPLGRRSQRMARDLPPLGGGFSSPPADGGSSSEYQDAPQRDPSRTLCY